MKTRKIITIAAAIFALANTFAQSVPSYVPTNNLVGWWPFNGNPNDQSANGFNGTVTGATLTNDRYGNPDKAYLFSSSANNISIQNNSFLCLSNTDFTINSWIKLDAFPLLGSSSEQYNQYYTILGKRQSGYSESNYSIGISTPSAPNGAGNLVFTQGPAGAGSEVYSNSAINAGVWNNISIVYTQSNQTIKLFVNNNLVIQQTGVTIPGENSANLWFGNDVSSKANYFPGIIDDIGIWNRALTQQELNSIYNSNNNCLLPTPTISASGSTTLCQGESVILTSSSPSGNTWSNGATTESITVSDSGSYSVTFSDESCYKTSNPVVVTVNPLPANLAITASGPTSFCEGGAVTLSLNNLSAVRYLKFESYYSSDDGQVNVNEIQAFSNGVNVALNKPGYANSYEYGNWSSNGANAVDGNDWNRWSSNRNDPEPDINNPHYIVIDLQSQFNLESVLLVINNFQQTYSFKVSQDGTNWIEIGSGNSVSGSFTFNPPTTNFNDLLWSNGETTQSITVSNSGSYSVKAFIGSTCSVTSNALAVTVSPLPTTPTISASGSTTLCQGESVILTSSSPSGNTWSNGATTQSITVTQSGSYSVSVSNSNCSSTSAHVVVTVTPLPNNPIILSSGPTSICEGGAVTLSLNNLSAVRYLKFESYYSSDSDQVNVYEIQAFSNGVNVALNKPGYANSFNASGNWSTNGYRAVDGNFGSRWSSNRNDPGPDINNPHYIVIDLQSQFNLESVLLVINNFQQTYSFKVSQDGTNWIEIGSGNSVSGSFTFNPPTTNFNDLLWSNGETTQSITVSNSGSYSVKAFIGSTCSVTSNAIAVTVSPLPTTPTISLSGSTTLCQGESVVLTSSSPSGNIWSNGATTESITVTDSGSYSVSVSNGDCSATSNPVVVTVSTLPTTLTISASGSTALCQGASIILTSSTPSGNTWSNGETTQSITVSNSGIYSVTSLGVCANAIGNDTSTVTVTELAVPTKPVTSAVTYCQYQTAIALTASEITTATTNWYDDPSAVTPYPNAPTPITDAVGTFNYYVSQTAANGCESDRVLIEVIVYPIYNASICYVTSDETQTLRNRIYVNNNGNYNVDTYQILREGDSAEVYDLIGEITPNQNSFLDIDADNSASSYKYKVKTKDISGLVSNESSSHKTILLQSSLSTNNNINLSWTPYDGISYGTYKIYRKVNDGVFELLKSISSSNLSYTDVMANTNENKYYYYVSIAVNSCSINSSTKLSYRNAGLTTQIKSNYKIIPKRGVDIPSTSTLTYCTGATIATAKGATSLKFYTTPSGGTSLAESTPLTTRTLYLTETIGGLESTSRVAKSIVVGLPTTAGAITTPDNLLCKYVGQTTPLAFTTPVVAGATYLWSVPTGVNIVSGSETNSLTVNFSGVSQTLAGTIGNIGVRVINAAGCASAAEKKFTLTTKIPTTPTKLILTSKEISLSSLATITKVGPYMGTSTVFTLKATDISNTAHHYRWDLPTGVTQLSGDTSNEITVDFSSVSAGTGNLIISVNSVGGCGESTTAKTLTLSRALPTKPSALTLTALASNTITLPIGTADKITNISPYAGKSTILTLVATPIATQGATATSYEWVFPSGVHSFGTTAKTVGEVTTISSVSNIITVDFSDVLPAVLSIPISVYAVNGVGKSLIKTLTLTSTVPATPGSITTTALAVPTYNPACSNTITVKVPPVFGVSNIWTVGSGATITSGQGTNSIVVNVSGVTTTKLVISVIASNGTGSSAAKTLTIYKVSTCRISTEEAVSENFKVVGYPNPSSSEFTIDVQSSSKGKPFGVQVYDVLGRLIEEQHTKGATLKIGANYQSGTYILKVSQGENQKTLQVIKK